MHGDFVEIPKVIVVSRCKNDGFDLIYGNGAFEQAKRRGATALDGYTIEDPAPAAVQTLRRLDESPLDTRVLWKGQVAAALAQLGLPLGAVAKVIGSSGHADAQRYANLGARSPAVHKAISADLKQGHLRYLAALNDEPFQYWCRRIASQRLTVAQLRDALRENAETSPIDDDLAAYAREVGARLNAPVKIRWPQDKAQRAIDITWYTPQDLQSVFAALARVETGATVTTGKAKRVRIQVEDADEVTAILGKSE